MASPNSSTPDRLAEAIRKFEEVLNDENKALFRIQGNQAPAPDVILESLIEKNEAEKLRKSRHFAQRMNPFFESILQFTSIVDTFVQANPSIAALVWGSVRVTIVALYNFSEYFDKMSTMFMKLGGLCPRIGDYKNLFQNSPRLQKCISNLYASIIKFCTEAILVIQRRGLAQFAHAIWKPFKVNFKDTEFRIAFERDELLEEVRVASECAAEDERLIQRQEREYQQTERTSAKTHRRDVRGFIQQYKSDSVYNARFRHQMILQLEDSRVRRLVDDQRIAEEKLRADQELINLAENRRDRLLAKMSRYNRSRQYERILRQRVPDTGQWLLASQPYIAWKQSSEPGVLVCSGIPGAGKTFLSANSVVDLMTAIPQNPVLYFFCDYGMEDSLKVKHIFASFLTQLCFYKWPMESMERKLDVILASESWESEDILEILETYMSSFSRITFLIDGVDEMKDADCADLFRWFQATLETSWSELTGHKAYIATRTSVDTSRFFPKAFAVEASMTNTAEDISLYIKHEIHKAVVDKRLIIRDPSLEWEIVDALINGADGMILWVKFQLHDLCEQLSDSGLRNTLGNLPTGLQGTYQRAWEKVSPLNQSIAKKMFMWIGHAKRPLTIAELADVIVVDKEQKLWDRSKVPTDFARLVRVGNNLVQYEKETGTVHFAHNTVREYLLTVPLFDGSTLLDPEASSRYLFDTCFTYLMFDTFQGQLVEGRKTPASYQSIESMGSPLAWVPQMARMGPRRRGLWGSITSVVSAQKQTKRSIPSLRIEEPIVQYNATENYSQYPFLDYASMNWTFHVTRACSAADFPTLYFEKLQLLIFDETRSFGNKHKPWLQDHNAISSDLRALLLHWAIKSGNYLVFRCALDVAPVQNLDYLLSQLGQSKLFIDAVKGGSFDIAIRLYKFYDIAECDEHKRNALHWACNRGYEELVQLIVSSAGQERYTSLNTHDDKGFTPFHAAIAGGHVDVIAYLHYRVDDMSDVVETMHKAIRLAIDKNRPDIISKLARNRKRKLISTSLDKAALIEYCIRSSHAECFRALRAILYPECPWISTLNDESEVFMQEQMAELEKVIAIMAPDHLLLDWYFLQAISRGYLKRSDFSSPLHNCAYEQKKEAIIRAISLGHSFPDFHDSCHLVKALHGAIEEKDLDLVQALISCTDKPTELISEKLEDKLGQNALHVAASRGSLEIAEFLIISLGRQDILPYLSTVDFEGTGLLAASAPDADMVSYFLKLHHQQCKESDDYSDTGTFLALTSSALRIASSRGYLKTVSLLLEFDYYLKLARPHILLSSDENLETCLHHAAGNGHCNVVTYLMDAEMKNIFSEGSDPRAQLWCIKNKEGTYAYELARKHKHIKVFMELAQAYTRCFDVDDGFKYALDLVSRKQNRPDEIFDETDTLIKNHIDLYLSKVFVDLYC